MSSPILSWLERQIPEAHALRDWRSIMRARLPALYSLVEYEQPALGLSDYIQLDIKTDPTTVRTADGTYLRTWRYSGPDRSHEPIEARARLNAVINDVYNDLDDGWAIWATLDRYPASDYPDATYPTIGSWLVGEERRQEFLQHRFYASDTYITLAYRSAKTSLKRKRATAYVDETTVQALDHAAITFEARCAAFEQSLAAHFRLEPLGLRTVHGPDGAPIVVDDQLALYKRILTGVRGPVRAIPNGVNIASYIASDTMIHRDAAVRIGRTLFRPITVIDFPDATTPDILDVLDQFAGEIIGSWRWISDSREAAAKRIKHVRGRAIQKKMPLSKAFGVPTNPEAMPSIDAAEMQSDTEMAQRKNENKSERFGYFTLTIAPLVEIADDETEADARARLDELAANVIAALRARYFLLSEELGNEAEALRAMVPGQVFDNVVRPMAGSRCLADFLPSTHSYRGLPRYDRRDEFFPNMPPLLVLYGHGRTPVNLVHSRPQRGGAMMLLGDPRSGKSSAAGLIANQFLQFHSLLPSGVAVVILDKGYSHRVQCRAHGGDHRELSPTTPHGLAIFADLETKGGFNFSLSILVMMASAGGLSKEQVKRPLAVALDAYQRGTRPPERTMTSFLASAPLDNNVRDTLRMWTRDGIAGNLFEGTRPLSLDNPFTVIEIGPLDDLEILKPIALFAVLQGVSRLVDGSRPILVVGEEVWTLGADPETDEWLLRFLKDKPKQGLSVALITHNLADLDRVRNPRAYIDACGTKLIFPSDSLTNSENIRRLSDVGLTEGQLRAHAENAGRNVALLVQDGHVATVALPMGPVSRAICGLTASNDRAMADDLYAAFPEDWLPELIYRVAGGGPLGEGWREHAYYYPPRPPDPPPIRAPHHATLHPNDPYAEIQEEQSHAS